jgi:hypothetical protein
VTAILFDSLSATTRPFATRAATAFVSTLAAENEYGGVFLAGLALTTVQTFTNRTADLRRAIDRVAMTAANNLSPEAERTRTPARTQGLDQATPFTAGAEYASGAVSIAEREARALRRHGGAVDAHGTAHGRGLQQVPGRVPAPTLIFLGRLPHGLLAQGAPPAKAGP